MKKILLSLVIIVSICFFVYEQSNNNVQIFKINSPTEFYIDENKNSIFDETSPIKIDDVLYISKNLNLENYPILKKLTTEEKFFLEYKANEFTKKTIKNKYVKYKNNQIFIGNKSYKQILLESNYLFNNNEETQKRILNYIKSINLNNYVIYNLKSKKYHRINCENGQQSNQYKIIHISKIPEYSIKCTNCLEKHTNQAHKEIKINETFTLGDIQIFFQDLNTIFKPSQMCNTTACKTLKYEIDNAEKTIDFAIYGINNQPEIIDSIIKAQKRGVKIRWVCDFDKKHINYYPDTQILKNKIKTFNTDEEYEKTNKTAIMHNKFFIFDNKKVWTGSSNITSTDFTGFNANYSILINSKEIANIYSQEFNQMYNGLFHSSKSKNSNNTVKLDDKTEIKILFSPQDKIITNTIIPLILQAKKYIYIPIFFLTHKDIEKALIQAHQNGVEIKIINDATNARAKYSINKQLRLAGIRVKTENYAGKMHMKAMIIDDNISVIGSMNFTKSANNKNDENVVIIYNSDIAQYMKKTFLHIWNKIPSKYENYDVRAESLESIGSCFDTIDNDFDDKIDINDEGCFQDN